MERKLLTQALVIGLTLTLLALVPWSAYSQPVTPTTEWVNFYGTSSTLDGQPLPIGAVVAAFDPDGVKCGEVTVSKVGSYGLMPCYRDDPNTSADEGAQPGDAIRFTINGLSATQLGPDAATWTANGDLKHVELSAASAPPTKTPTPTSPPPPPSTATPTVTPTPTPTPTGTPPPTPAPCVGFYYKVRWGDTIYSIARRFGVSVAAIVRCNNLADPSFIWVGQQLLIPTGTPSPPPAPAPCEGFYYQVRWGDWIYSIARRFGVLPSDIISCNNLVNPNSLRVGQQLLIPVGAPSPDDQIVYTVRWGDTLYSIARRFSTTVQAIASANGILNPNYIYVGQRLIIPAGVPAPPSARYYTVQPGDTLWRIALRYRTTVWAIAIANNLGYSYVIYPGQVLVIP